MRVQLLTIEHLQYIAHALAQQTMEWNEPIPKFETRYPQVLGSCITAPFQRFNRKFLYTGLSGKAAILFYLLIKNHPFQNGNKRIAVTALLLFLHLNGRWLRVDTVELYNFAVWVAQSPPGAKEEVVVYIEKFVRKHLVDRDSG